jgi:hypothetical protein
MNTLGFHLLEIKLLLRAEFFRHVLVVAALAGVLVRDQQTVGRSELKVLHDRLLLVVASRTVADFTLHAGKKLPLSSSTGLMAPYAFLIFLIFGLESIPRLGMLCLEPRWMDTVFVVADLALALANILMCDFLCRVSLFLAGHRRAYEDSDEADDAEIQHQVAFH